MNEYLNKFITIIIIIIITFLINKVLDSIIDNTIKKRNKKNITTLFLFIKRIKKIVLYAICILICLYQFESFKSFTVTILSGLGIGSVVLGLAAQESLKNFFGSVSLVLGNAYEVGDFIECVDMNVSGTVEEITMRHTIIRTVHNRRIMIPNSEMNTYTIENFNYGESENVKMVDFSISYEADIDKAMDLIKDEMNKLYHPNPKGKNKTAEFPKVRVYKWDSSGIVLRAWVWGSDNGNAFENMYTLNYTVKKRFDEAGIEIPYPHVVTIKGDKK